MRYFWMLYSLYLLPSLLSGQAEGKQIAFRHLTIEQGLSQNTILSIAQDSIGYMWFATQNGLNKYNGKSFKHYNKQFQNVTRSTFSRLGKVYVDKQNQLWIVSGIGQLERYQPDSDDFKKIETNFVVSTIFQTNDYSIYLGTYDNGIYKIDAKSNDTIQVLKANDRKLTAYDFLEVDKVFYATTSRGIVRFNTDNSYVFLKSSIPKGSNVSTMVVNASKSVFFGTYGQGLYFKPNSSATISKITKIGAQELPEDLNIEALLIDRLDRLWVATYGNGLYVLDFNAETIQQFKAQKNNPFAVHYNDILCLFEDSTGNIWLGTDGAGASYFDEHLVKFNLLTNKQLPQGVNVDVIRSITTDDNNNIWLGTSGHGLTYIDLQAGNHHTITVKNSKINSDRVVSLAYINKALWIGHQNSGLNLMTLDKRFETFPEIETTTIWKILPIDENQVWLATERSGVILFDKNRGVLKRFNMDNSDLGSNNIRALIKGDAYTLWLGSVENGLYKIDLSNDTVFKIPDINDDIKALLYTPGILWVGTSGNGLKRLDLATQTIKLFTEADGLPNQVVYSVLPDKDSNFWLSTNYGLCKFTYKENEKPEIENFTNLNGLQGLEFNTGAYYKDTNGILYFGGLEGVNWFEPNQITTNAVKPQTVITGIDVFNKPVDFSETLELKFNQNTVTFTFSGLHFSQPERNQYRYKLVNNDENWIAAGNNNVAHYTNLPPNDYEFQVYSSNYDGIWDDTAAIYKFSILSPWFATTTAKWFYALLIGLMMYAIYAYLKFRWEVRTQLRLEHAETERLKKLDEFKTKLYTNISHEIRTPLTLISGPIEQQLEKPQLSDIDKQELQLVKQNADRLLNLANQMMDLSLVESGQLRLKVSKADLGVLLNQMVSAFKFKADEKFLEFKTSIDTIGLGYFDKDIIQKVVSNLLSNAMKYAPPKSIVVMDAAKQNEALVLSVINQYNALNKKDLSTLFRRFYQEDEAADGIGVGLALVKELVSVSKGSIIANNIDSDKIQFTVTLPLNKNAFDASQIIENNLEVSRVSDAVELEYNEENPILLIVEDDAEIRSFIVSLFIEDYQILEAEDGNLGSLMAKQKLPNIIISDVMMPNVDGITMCKDLKTDELTSHIPIILLTAKVGEANEIEGLETGADAYITKPFNTKKLKTQVEQLIATRKQLKSHYSQGFTLNPEMAVTSAETQFLERLQTTLDAHITDSDFTSERFCELLVMSRAQLHRKLKALTGQSTSEFIRSQRLKLAEQLLKETTANVSEIAYQVGFNSPSYFTKCFKEQYGVTPNDFVKA